MNRPEMLRETRMARFEAPVDCTYSSWELLLGDGVRQPMLVLETRLRGARP